MASKRKQIVLGSVLADEEYLVSTSDSSLPLYRQQRDYLSGPNMSTSILPRLTLVLREVRLHRLHLETIKTRDFWKEMCLLPELIKLQSGWKSSSGFQLAGALVKAADAPVL
jgi:hypothetical protein